MSSESASSTNSLTRPIRASSNMLMGNGAGSIVVRRLWPVMLSILVALDWLILRGIQASLFTIEAGTALHSVLSIVVFTALLWMVAQWLNSLEQRIAAERTLLRKVLDNLPDQIFVKDKAGRYLISNIAQRDSVGATSWEEIIGKDDYDLFPQALADQFTADEHEVLREGRTLLAQEELSWAKRGSRMWVVTTKVPWFDSGGQIAGLIGISRDITERKRIQETLTEERKLLRTVIDTLPDPIYVKDRESRFVTLNNAQVRLVRASSVEALIGKTDLDYFPKDFAAKFYADEQRIIATGQALIEHEELTVGSVGKPIWMLTTKVPWLDHQGHIIGIVGISRDITERKRIEEDLRNTRAELEQRVKERTAALSEANNRLQAEIVERRRAEEILEQERNLLRTLIDNLPDHIYVKDTQSRFLEANIATCQLLGVPDLESLIGKTDFDFLSADMAEPYYAAEQAMFRMGQEMLNWEQPYQERMTGKLKWNSSTKIPLRDSKNQVIGLVGIGHDITERKEMEQALRQSEERFRAIVEDQTELICRWLPGGIVSFANEAYCRYFGEDRDSYIGHSFMPHVYKEDRDRLSRLMTTLDPEHPSLVSEHRVVTLDGLIRWTQWTNRVIFDQQGNMLEVQAVGRDITERKQAEDELRMQALVFETLFDGVIVTDMEGRITDWNPGAERIYGYNKVEALGQTTAIIHDNLKAETLTHEILDHIQQRGRFSREINFLRKDGSKGISETTVVPVHDENSRFIASIGVNRDITEQKQAEDELRRLNTELERRVQDRTSELQHERTLLQTILDSMGEGVFFSENRVIRYVNRAMAELTGYGTTELVGQPNHILKSGTAAGKEVLFFDSDLLSPDVTWRGEVNLRRKDSTVFNAALTVRLIPLETGSLGDVTIVRDVTMEKQLQAQKNQFIANASHELRTPITNVKTRLYLLRKQPERLDVHIDVLERVVEHMASLVEDLLDVSRFERGVILLRREEVILQTLIEEAVQIQQLEAATKHVSLEMNMMAEPLHVYADPTRITQVLINLLTNAINYTPERGQIAVELALEADNAPDRETPGCAVIRVRDTGQGIASEHLSRIYEPFFRANEGSVRGTGLGLSISKEIIELHGGQMSVESQPGEGSIFTIRLAASNANTATS